MRYKKRNGLYVPKHYMGCMGIEDVFPPNRSNVSAVRKGVMSPAGGGGNTGGSAGYSSPAEPAGYLLVENFEADGYVGWTEEIGANGIVDEDDTTATVLRGAQQLKVYGGDSAIHSYAVSPHFTDTSPIYGHVLVKFPTLPTQQVAIISNQINIDVRDQGIIYLNPGGTLYMEQGTGNATTTDALSINTKYHIWWRWTTDSGGDNGVFWVEFTEATTYSPVGSGTKYAGNNNGSNDNNVDTIRLGAGASSGQGYSFTIYFDQLYVDEAPIASVNP